MKIILFISLCVFSTITNIQSQTVTTLSNTGKGMNDAIIYMEDGSIVGSDHEGNSVYKLLSDGSVQTLVSGINSPNGLELDGEGNFYIGAPKENKIYKFSTDGTLSEYIPNILNPNNLIFQKNSDTLIVASYVYSKIYKVAPDGTVFTLFDGAPLNGPLGMTYDDEDNLYIANFTDGKVFRVNGNNLELFATVPGATVTGLEAAIGYIKFINGIFYATSFGKNKIYTITRSGQVEDFVGSGLAGTIDGDATSVRFYWPNGICSNSTGDTLYISEYNSHAVRIITDFVTDIKATNEAIPTKYQLEQNYPNPFNPSTQIMVSIPKSGNYTLRVYNVLGQEAAILFNNAVNAGIYTFNFDASNLTSGIYFYNFTGDNFTQTRKMMLMK